MLHVHLLILVEHYNIVYNFMKIFQASKCFIHSFVVMFSDGVDSIQGTQIFEPSKWGYACYKLLTFFIKWTLVVTQSTDIRPLKFHYMITSYLIVISLPYKILLLQLSLILFTANFQGKVPKGWSVMIEECQ